MSHPRSVLVVIASVMLLSIGLVPIGAEAQSSPATPATFGIATEIAYVVPASEFATFDSGNGWSFTPAPDSVTGSLLRETSSSTSWVAGVRLPAGAVVTRLEVAGCDTSATASLVFSLWRSQMPPRSGFQPVSLLGTTGPAADMPGCGRFSTTPMSPPLVIDNANATYWILLGVNAGVSFDSVRVYYQLQVSPAPATASFGDVPPTHPFFQFVEALVASGITVGCGGGNYCPDAPLTRGQMAAFLSKGLGLHFAP
jgi:hypothetical protein